MRMDFSSLSICSSLLSEMIWHSSSVEQPKKEETLSHGGYHGYNQTCVLPFVFPTKSSIKSAGWQAKTGDL